MSTDLNTNNLYANGSIVQFENGEQILIRPKFTIDQFTNFDYYTVTQGEELTSIAQRVYGRKVKDPSKYWGVIADVNNIFDPLDLSKLVGTDIYVPDILEVKKLSI